MGMAALEEKLQQIIGGTANVDLDRSCHGRWTSVSCLNYHLV
jgi:hypothetical protein